MIDEQMHGWTVRWSLDKNEKIHGQMMHEWMDEERNECIADCEWFTVGQRLID